MPANRLDIRRVAEAVLSSAERLVPLWLPQGHREGHEWKALNPTRADSKIGSFSINLTTGAWGDFATDDKGGDLVSLYAYLEGINNLAAATKLAAELGVASAARPAVSTSLAPAKASDWTPQVPVPDGAPDPPVAHFRRGKAEAFWDYRDAQGALLARIMRFRTSDGGKEVLPYTYCRNDHTGELAWHQMQLPVPRALYGLDRLQPGVVLVVEGEKCVEAARPVLPTFSVLTWPGGGKAVDRADWTLIAGRKVIIWPDCDAQLDKTGELLPEDRQPGIKAAERIAEILLALGSQVRIVAIPAPGAKPSGWDVADAIAEGWSNDQVLAFIRDNLRPSRAEKSVATPLPAAPLDDWQGHLVRGGNGALLAVTANAYAMLVHRSEWRDVLAFDEFASRAVKRMPPPYERGVAGEWGEMDDSFTSLWLATAGGLARISTAAAAEASEMAARSAPFDPVRCYLEGLTWDGTPRNHCWLSDFFGAPDTPYMTIVGRLWLLGMVRRVFEPGCKFDYMPILEGPQGRGKSTALEILAHPWFGNTDFVMGDKDSMAVMQGKWLYEIAELDSFNKADTTRVKSFVTRQVDEFRPAYGRRILRLPRRVVLVGTTNQYEYFKDSTGNRRFWPIKCVDDINLDGLRESRDQLLAEAVVRYRAGERGFPSREEQDAHITPEQESREISDAWEESVHRFLHEVDVSGDRPERVSMLDVLVKGLGIEKGKLTKEMTTRVGLVMRKLGWNKREQRGEHPRFVYERPKKSANVTSAATAEPDDVPI